jgi:hypothetical protein
MSQAVVIQEVTDTTIVVDVNGEIKSISNQLVELKQLLQSQQVQTFQSAEKIYNINHINEANFDFVTGRKTFNEILTRRLIEALQDSSEPARNFLSNASSRTTNWETKSRISDVAKEIISYSYVGVLGIQLRKLMAIGKEDLSESKQRKYLENCLLTLKRALQLLCFAMLSRLWDCKKSSPGKYGLNENQRAACRRFFDDQFGADLEEYVRLLKILLDIFEDHMLDLPIAELNDLKINLSEESDFMKACTSMQALSQLFERSAYTLVDCYEAEKQLVVALESLKFLANYKMVSIRNIDYYEMRDNPPRFLHNYTALGFDNRSNVNLQRVNYMTSPINTDAVLLFKETYLQGVNLFPFIIDMNALSFEGGTKICFYTRRDETNDGLCYSFLEDNREEKIFFLDTLKSLDINDLMQDQLRRKEFKFNNIFDLFKEARRVILDEQARGEGSANT